MTVCGKKKKIWTLKRKIRDSYREQGRKQNQRGERNRRDADGKQIHTHRQKT